MALLNALNGRVGLQARAPTKPVREGNSHHVGQIVEQLGGFLVMTAAKVKELGRALNEGGGGLPTQELRVPKNDDQESSGVMFDVSKWQKEREWISMGRLTWH